MSDPALRDFLSGFAAPGGPDWFQQNREAALAAFGEIGLPGTRQEDWKYTDIRPIARRHFRSPAPAAADPAAPDPFRLDGGLLEFPFLNGRFAAAGKTPRCPSGVTVRPLAKALTEPGTELTKHLAQYADIRRNGFVALNTAFLEDGALVHVTEDASAAPIHLLFVSGAADEAIASCPRNLILVDPGAHAIVIESYAGAADSEYFTDAITEIVLGAGSTLEHYRLQQEGSRAFHVGCTVVHQDRDSRLLSHSLSLGGALVRTDLDVRLTAPGAEVMLNGLYLAGGRQHIDNHTRIDHFVPHTRSEETFRGVLDQRGRAVFNGKVVVHPGAVKTDAAQSNANLLLSDRAEVDAKPELEIYADDVKCSHGATVGRLDPDMLFYLRSRAVPETTARTLLIFAFVDDVIRRIGIAPVRERTERSVLGRLPDADLIREFVR